jgi:indole-3-glycerol phosphate synthase
MQRSLQQLAGPAGAANFEGVTNVTTPEELQEAVSAGARHILITEHLDLTTLKIIPTSKLPIILGMSNNTWTIRVCLSFS